MPNGDYSIGELYMNYYVAEGFAFTTKKRGILAPGAEISEKDFASREHFLKTLEKKKITAKITPARKDGHSSVEQSLKEKQTAKSILEAAIAEEENLKTEFEKAKSAHGEAKDKLEQAVTAKIDKRIANKDLNDAYEALVKAEDTQTKAGKKDKAEAEAKTAEARAKFEALENADEGYKAAKAVMETAKADLDKVESAMKDVEIKYTNAVKACDLAQTAFNKLEAE
jgi:hypothetical protein